MEEKALKGLNKVDKGLQFMLQAPEKEETIFSLIWSKMITLFNKEFHLRFEFNIKPKRRIINVSRHNISS